MKKVPEIKEMLGLTQEEIAMLLSIPRSQWTMFKSGQRGLPPKAMLKLAAVLQSVQNEKGESEEISRLLANEEQQTKMLLKEDEIKMESKRRRIQNEIAIAERNRADAFAAFQTIAQLRKEAIPDEGLILIIRDRALKTLSKYSQYNLEQLQMKQISIEYLQLQMQQKIMAKKGEVQFLAENI